MQHTHNYFLLVIVGCSLNGVGSSPKLLDWDTVQRKLPWNVVILLGAGFVLAEASKVGVFMRSSCVDLET